MTKYITTLIMSLCCIAAAGQNKCNITGTVVDTKGEAISYASAVLYDDGKIATGGVTSDNGKFILTVDSSSKEFELSVEFIGYIKKVMNISPTGRSLNLGNITLEEDIHLLDEVVVTARTEALKASLERTSINASANMSSSKGSAIDVLNSASSVTISNDVISIRGNSNILVLIDGIPTTVSDLSAIPAANIKNIDIITNPDASYDAGGTGGIINIVSKKGGSKGLSGVVAANYGFNHFVTGNAAFTFNRPKASYRFTYNTKYEDDVVNTTLDRTLHHSGTRTLQQMQSTRYTYNNNIGLGADFRINKRNALNLDLKCIIPRLNVSQNLQNTFVGTYTERGENRHNDVTWNRENLEATIAYKHIIQPEVSDISIKGSISKIWGHRPSYYFLEGKEVNRSNSGGSPFITALQGDYVHKYKAGTLSAGAKIDRKFSYKAGLRGEFSTVTLSSTHENLQETNNSFFLAPSLSGTYKLTGKDELAIAFSRRIGRRQKPDQDWIINPVDKRGTNLKCKF